MNKKKPIDIHFYSHPYIYDDPGYIEKDLNNDIEKIKDYFLDKNRDFIYNYEANYLLAVLYYDNRHKTNLLNSLFSIENKNNNSELKELKDNFSYLSNSLKEKKVLNFNLYLWTIFKTYHYFLRKNQETIIDESSFSLINSLLEMCFIFFNGVKLNLVEKELPKEEVGFVRHVCGLLSHDLLSTITNEFPEYYDPVIMFLGYQLYTPAGCSDLYANMESFSSYVKGIADYDYWFKFEEGMDGETFFNKTIRIKNDYEKLRKGIFKNESI